MYVSCDVKYLDPSKAIILLNIFHCKIWIKMSEVLYTHFQGEGKSNNYY